MSVKGPPRSPDRTRPRAGPTPQAEEPPTPTPAAAGPRRPGKFRVDPPAGATRNPGAIMNDQSPYNGIPAADLTGAAWRKSSHSNSQGACVEFALL
ncbi:MAG: DUF397 domain-containing protein, partial [Actinocrinis sp.]